MKFKLFCGITRVYGCGMNNDWETWNYSCTKRWTRATWMKTREYDCKTIRGIISTVLHIETNNLQQIWLYFSSTQKVMRHWRNCTVTGTKTVNIAPSKIIESKICYSNSFVLLCSQIWRLWRWDGAWNRRSFWEFLFRVREETPKMTWEWESVLLNGHILYFTFAGVLIRKRN